MESTLPSDVLKLGNDDRMQAINTITPTGRFVAMARRGVENSPNSVPPHAPFVNEAVFPKTLECMPQKNGSPLHTCIFTDGFESRLTSDRVAFMSINAKSLFTLYNHPQGAVIQRFDFTPGSVRCKVIGQRETGTSIVCEDHKGSPVPMSGLPYGHPQY